MKIINNNGNWKLQYTYKIITNRHKRDDNTPYYFYTTQLSYEIINYFKTCIFYVYKKDEKLYLTTKEPTDYVYKKIKARNKYTQSKIRVIPLNPKLFNLTGDVKDKYLNITLNLNKQDYVSDDILVNLDIC